MESGMLSCSRSFSFRFGALALACASEIIHQQARSFLQPARQASRSWDRELLLMVVGVDLRKGDSKCALGFPGTIDCAGHSLSISLAQYRTKCPLSSQWGCSNGSFAGAFDMESHTSADDKSAQSPERIKMRAGKPWRAGTLVGVVAVDGRMRDLKHDRRTPHRVLGLSGRLLAEVVSVSPIGLMDTEDMIWDEGVDL